MSSDSLPETTQPRRKWNDVFKALKKFKERKINIVFYIQQKYLLTITWNIGFSRQTKAEKTHFQETCTV